MSTPEEARKKLLGMTDLFSLGLSDSTEVLSKAARGVYAAEKVEPGPTQQTFLRRLCHHLDDERYIFMGHSETLHGMQLPLGQKAPSVYRKLAT